MLLQDLQLLENGGRAIGTYIITGKVNRSGGEVDRELGFDVDIAQWGAVNHQTVRFTCFFPTCHPRLTKTPMPPAGRHVALQGVLNDIDEDRGLVYIQDISFTHTGETIQAEAPSSKLKHFDWYGKGKQKRARYAESTEENAAGPSGLSSK